MADIVACGFGKSDSIIGRGEGPYTACYVPQFGSTNGAVDLKVGDGGTRVFYEPDRTVRRRCQGNRCQLGIDVVPGNGSRLF